jgi:hypothetical protein
MYRGSSSSTLCRSEIRLFKLESLSSIAAAAAAAVAVVVRSEV